MMRGDKRAKKGGWTALSLNAKAAASQALLISRLCYLPGGSEGLGAKAKMILKEAQDEGPLQYVNTCS